jgi:hypothetical protein
MGDGFNSETIYSFSQDIGEGDYYIRHGFLWFTIPTLPEGVVVTNAVLSMYINSSYPYYNYGLTDMGIYHLMSDWDETMTWATQPEMELINIFDAPIGGQTINVNLTTEVAALVADPTSNHGWGIKYITDEIPGSYRYVEFGGQGLDPGLINLTIGYTYSSETPTVWSLEHQSSIVAPETYSYTVSDTYSYMGGAATTIGDNVYFAYISHSQETGVNPQTGNSEDYLQFNVKMLKKVSGVWSEEIIYEYPPMFSIGGMYSTYYGLLNSYAIGYPFGLENILTVIMESFLGKSINIPESETFLLSITAKTDSDIVVIFPTWNRFESSGIPDLMIANYNGNEWVVKDVRINDWDAGSRVYGNITIIQPSSIIYDEYDRLIIAYKLYVSPLETIIRKIIRDYLTVDINGLDFYIMWMAINLIIPVPIKYAKLENDKWVSLGELTKSITGPMYLMNYGTVNMLKISDSMIVVIGKLADEQNDDGISLFKKTLYYE